MNTAEGVDLKVTSIDRVCSAGEEFGRNCRRAGCPQYKSIEKHSSSPMVSLYVDCSPAKKTTEGGKTI